jgi:predicted HicB family RNase H-like nuclease
MNDISLHGSMFVGPYKGYHGRAEFDAEAGAFHGELTDTKDVITFVGRNPAELTTAFKESVDDYLAFCESRGESPDKPFSGNFVVRITPQLHHDLWVNATQSDKSLIQYVREVLETAARSELDAKTAKGNGYARLAYSESFSISTPISPPSAHTPGSIWKSESRKAHK